jgi:hypothetical protein
MSNDGVDRSQQCHAMETRVEAPRRKENRQLVLSWRRKSVYRLTFSHAPVAQLDRASASEAEGCGFDPRRAQFDATLQQRSLYCKKTTLAVRRAQANITFFRRIVAGIAFAGFVIALVLAASPKLHSLAHDSDRMQHHECLAMVLQNGACDDVAPTLTLAAFVTTLFEAALPDESRSVESLFLSCRILEHAPPVIS